MTIGNVTIDQRVNVVYSIDNIPDGSTLSGTYVTKSWNGSDGARTSRPARKVRKYTTVSRSGKVIKGKFYERTPKRAVSLEPHNYTMNAFKFRATGYNSVNNYTVNGVPVQQTLQNYSQPVAAPLLPTLPDWTANDDIKLINKLKERSRGSDFNLSLFLSQGHQGLQMIGDSAIRIARGLSLLKRGNVIGAVHEMSKSATQTATIRHRLIRKDLWTANLRLNASKQLSSNWLELQYGWLPLLQDMKSGAELAASQLNVPMRMRIRVRHTLRNDKPNPGAVIGWQAGVAINSKSIVAHFSEPESIPKLLGLTDPASIAWEVTPFSFVADWFLPVGDWLEARAYASGLSGLFVSTTFQKRTATGYKGLSYSYQNSSDTVVGNNVVTGGEYYCDIVSLSRVVGTSLSVPKPTYKGLEKAASWQHCVNGLALMMGIVRSSGFKTPARGSYQSDLLRLNRK